MTTVLFHTYSVTVSFDEQLINGQHLIEAASAIVDTPSWEPLPQGEHVGQCATHSSDFVAIIPLGRSIRDAFGEFIQPNEYYEHVLVTNGAYGDDGEYGSPEFVRTAVQSYAEKLRQYFAPPAEDSESK